MVKYCCRYHVQKLSDSSPVTLEYQCLLGNPPETDQDDPQMHVYMLRAMPALPNRTGKAGSKRSIPTLPDLLGNAGIAQLD